MKYCEKGKAAQLQYAAYLAKEDKHATTSPDSITIGRDTMVDVAYIGRSQKRVGV